MKLNTCSRITAFLTLVLIVCALSLISGCGGSSGSLGNATSASALGTASLVINWPTSTTRLIPVATNSITVSFLNGTTVVSTQTVARPNTGNTSTITFSGLPATDLTLTSTAYPTTVGSGTAQASARKAVTVIAGQTTPFAITMGSTITSISASTGSSSVAVGATALLSASPQDSTGATVLVNGTLQYTSLDTSVATISSSGIITGVKVGTASIRVTESESGVSTTIGLVVTAGAGATVSDAALSYYGLLTSTQKSATLVPSSAANVAKWSDLSAIPASNGSNTLRNGVSYSTLTTDQKSAWNSLVNAALTGQTGTKFSEIRASDNYLATIASGYSGDYQYVGFVGTPSSTGNWVLQIGGHNVVHNFYYTGNTLKTSTPYFLATEPNSFSIGGTSYTPLESQRATVSALLGSFTTDQLTEAQLGSSYSDVLLGPGQDARSLFPTSGRGLLASSLTGAQQAFLKSVIAAWTQLSPLSNTYQSLYEDELSSTYVGYSGNSGAPGTVFTTQGDYIRIDGPHVWIEFVCKNGEVVTNQVRFRSVWRDRVSDYNAAFGF